MSFFDNEEKVRPTITKKAPVTSVIRETQEDTNSVRNFIEQGERSGRMVDPSQLPREMLYKMSINVNKEDYLDLKEFVGHIKQFRKDNGIKLPFDGSKVSLNPIMKAMLAHLVERLHLLHIENLIFEDDVYNEISKLFVDLPEN